MKYLVVLHCLLTDGVSQLAISVVQYTGTWSNIADHTVMNPYIGIYKLLSHITLFTRTNVTSEGEKTNICSPFQSFCGVPHFLSRRTFYFKVSWEMEPRYLQYRSEGYMAMVQYSGWSNIPDLPLYIYIYISGAMQRQPRETLTRFPINSLYTIWIS